MQAHSINVEKSQLEIKPKSMLNEHRPVSHHLPFGRTFGSIIGMTNLNDVGCPMKVQKLSISLSQHDYEFIEKYQIDHHYKTRSEVIKEALNLLQQTQLEAFYLEANQEIDDAFENANSDGIETNEAW